MGGLNRFPPEASSRQAPSHLAADSMASDLAVLVNSKTAVLGEVPQARVIRSFRLPMLKEAMLLIGMTSRVAIEPPSTRNNRLSVSSAPPRYRLRYSSLLLVLPLLQTLAPPYHLRPIRLPRWNPVPPPLLCHIV